MKYFEKSPNDLFSSNFNEDFVSKDLQKYVFDLFNYM
jgi:hypothetical protein